VPAHIETWAIDDGCSGGVHAGERFVRDWVTFAETHCDSAARKARRDCRGRHRTFCRVMQYLDTDWQFPADTQRARLGRASGGGWWLHSPGGGGPIFSSTFGGGYLINQTRASARAFFGSFVRRNYNRDDGLLMDWQSPSLAQELYYADCGCASTSEVRTSAELRASHQQMSAALRHRNGAPFMQIDNSLPPNQYLPQGLGMLNHSIGIDGWSIEGVPEDDGTMDPFYANLLDQMAYIVTKTRSLVIPMSRGAAGASYQSQSRRVQEATVLLAYRPGRVVDWAELEDGNGHLAVWPEEGIYPTRPLQSMRAPGGRGCLSGTGVLCTHGGHNSVRVAHGVYRREFGSCYFRSKHFGSCAVILNATGSGVTVKRSWLRRTYHHQITFKGGDVQSGGSLDFTGAPFRPGTTAVPARDALLLEG
jgi:hypothetical protein